MDIFKEKRLYPYENDSIVDHYSFYFDNVFVGLIPFFEVQNHPISDKYPDDKKILENGTSIPWTHIIQNTKIKNFKELNKALMTSIGAYKKPLERPDLLNELYRYTESKNIWDPSEGTFDLFTKKKIYEICKAHELYSLVVRDEFYDKTEFIDLRNLTLIEFIDKIDFKDYFIYSENKEILFAIDWDFYFFFVSFKGGVIEKSTIENSFEGFWATENETHNWTWEKGEIETILTAAKSNEKKLSWWKRLMNDKF